MIWIQGDEIHAKDESNLNFANLSTNRERVYSIFRWSEIVPCVNAWNITLLRMLNIFWEIKNNKNKTKTTTTEIKHKKTMCLFHVIHYKVEHINKLTTGDGEQVEWFCVAVYTYICIQSQFNQHVIDEWVTSTKTHQWDTKTHQWDTKTHQWDTKYQLDNNKIT